jgi:hypothetical protein
VLQSIHQQHYLLAKLSGSVKPKRLPDGSYLAIVSKKRVDPERSTDKRKCWISEQILVRVIVYQIPGFRAARLITTLLDPSISAKELVIHYHKRWDIGVSGLRAGNLVGESPTEAKRLKPRSWGGAVARKQDGEALRQSAPWVHCNASGCNVQ